MPGCLSRFECTRIAGHDGGDHVIVVARVTAAAMREGEPLLFSAGGYGRFDGFSAPGRLAVVTAAPHFALLKPLPLGSPIVYWRLGATHEARYDVADRPLEGEMDPFFFLTSTRTSFRTNTHAAPSSPPSAAAGGHEPLGRVRAQALLAAFRFAPGRPLRLLVPPDRDRHLGARR